MSYSIEPRNRIYVKGYGFLTLAKNMGTQLSNKYNQKRFDNTKKSTTSAIKTTSKKAIQRKAEATSDLIGNKIADKITSVSKKSSAKFRSQNDEANDESEASKERHISPENRKQVIDELRLV